MNMRRNIYIAAAGAMALMLASCSSDEPLAVNTTDGAIAYRVVTANQTRAGHSFCANNMPDAFKVWAKNADGLYINGDNIQKGTDGVYTDIDGIRYWPKADNTMAFYAIVDDAGKFSFNDGAPTVDDYVIEGNVENQLDLMYAVKPDAPKTEVVKLNFRHALSQVCFKALNENPNVRITVNSVSVGGLLDKGTYTLPEETTESNYISHPENGSRNNLGSWSNTSGNASYTVALPNIVMDGAATEATDLTCGSYDGDHKDNWYDNVLNLLPQQQKKNEVASNAKADPTEEGAWFKLNLTVENRVKNDAGTYEYQIVTTNEDFYIGVDINWEEGIRYIYTFRFPIDWDPENLSSIKYKVSVDDFLNQNATMDLPDFNGKPAILIREEGEGGLPALWIATKNIGAETPLDYGKYFWWGDTIGYYKEEISNFPKIDDIPTYNVKASELSVYVDMTTGTLKPIYDAAHTQWQGDWRLPTRDDYKWIKDHSKKVNKETADGKKYIEITINGKYTYQIPAAGEWGINTGSGSWKENEGRYWTGSISYVRNSDEMNWDSKTYAMELLAGSSSQFSVAGSFRCNGKTIRPVASVRTEK